ncbi:MAG: hypothetical protein HYW49_09800 [Deltaproteobacteria bacterium]|nr:hypothetical protein [Deltaproteobacteria bacterium]
MKQSSEDFYCTRTNSRAALWAGALFILGFLLAFFSPPASAAIQTRIVSINGNYQTTHAASLTVYTGDVISLMADQLDLDAFGNVTGLYRRSEEFIWNTDIRSTDFCAPAWADCAGSNFETHEYGVNFYVPANMPQNVTLTVLNRNDGSYDQIKLSYAGSRAPSYAGGSGGGYYDDNGSFDHNSSLAGYGRWVYINGDRVFVPYSYVSNWQPYQHGYWYWTSYGWAWYSYDPWGWVTDHYGYWRHHGTYGWVWMPFTGSYYTWRPCVVTFYYTSGGIGWSPYWSGYGNGYWNGYSSGYNHGYNDGYWNGYNAGLNAGSHFGTTFVQNNHFTSVNIYNVQITNVTVVNNYYTEAVHANAYGQVLGSVGGVVSTAVTPKQFVESRGVTVAEVPVQVIPRPTAGGGTINVVRPRDAVSVPTEYQQAATTIGRPRNDNTPVPVGSVINPKDGVVTPPRGVGNGRDVVIAPKKPDGTTLPPIGRPSRPEPSQPEPTIPSRPQPTTPTRPTPMPTEPSRPAPSRPEPSRPEPTFPSRPTPSQPSRPQPSQPSRPAPSRPSGGGGSGYTPRPAPSQPSRPAPAPSRPAPMPSRGGGGHR